MILPVIVCILAWNRVQGKLFERALGISLVAVLITGLTVATAGSIPVIEIPTGPNQELRVMPFTAFPFTMQQHRNYDTNQFYYRIVIGWPNGPPIYEGLEVDDQSEFIHQTHFYTAILLGEDIAAGLLMSLSVLFVSQRRQKRENDDLKQRNIAQLLLPMSIFSLSLFLFIFSHHLSYVSLSPWIRVVFWGVFVGLGVYTLALFNPDTAN
ncbi:MAG: hypothetical protein ACXACG_10895 [Candidatus Thorarchaeota archaeon]